MKKKKFFAFIIILLFSSLIFVYIINKPPWIYDKTVFDIRNNSNKKFENAYLLIEKSSTFKIPDGESYYVDKIQLPAIKAGKRIIVILDQGTVSIPGMQLRLSCGNFNDCIDDELHKDSGALHIIKINRNGHVNHETVNDSINQCFSLFSWKHFSEIFDVTP